MAKSHSCPFNLGILIFVLCSYEEPSTKSLLSKPQRTQQFLLFSVEVLVDSQFRLFAGRIQCQSIRRENLFEFELRSALNVRPREAVHCRRGIQQRNYSFISTRVGSD